MSTKDGVSEHVRQPTMMMQLRSVLHPHRRYLKWLRQVARWQLSTPLPYDFTWRFARWVSLLTTGADELVKWDLPGTRMSLALDLTEATQADLYYRGLPQPELLDVIKPYFRSDGVFVDVGANVGQEALWAAHLYLSDGVTSGPKVFAFEPNPTIVRRLQHNVAANSVEGLISVNAVGVSDVNGTAAFYLAPEDNGSNSSLAPNRFFGGEVINVPVVTLDSFFSGHHSKRPVALLKIDVEGGELRVLRGSTHLLSSDRPVMILEACPHLIESFGHTYSELHHYIVSLRYSVFIVRQGAHLIPDTDGQLPGDAPYYNLVCLPLT